MSLFPPRIEVVLVVALLGVTACRTRTKGRDAGAGATTLTPTPAAASQKSGACSWGEAAGLPPSMPWSDAAERGVYRCKSKNRNYGSMTTLTYWAKGSKAAVEMVYLTLVVMEPEVADTAQEDLADSFGKVLFAAHGVQIEPSTREAISKGETRQLLAAGYPTRITKEFFPTGKGYELRVVLDVR